MSSKAGAIDPTLASTRRHRRESFWQITFPIVAIALIFIGLTTALYIIRGAQALSVAADYAAVIVILPMCFLGLLIVALIGAIIFGVVWIQVKIPPYSNRAQRIAGIAYRYVDKAMDIITSFAIGGFAIIGGFINTLQKWGIVPEDNQSSSTDHA
jgi:hypothetical protein